MKFAFEDFSHSGNLAYGQALHKVGHHFRRNRKEPIWLFPVAGNFGEKLVGGYAAACGQVAFAENRRADFLKDAGRAAAAVGAVRKIQIGLVQGKRLDAVRKTVENFGNCRGLRLVAGHIYGKEDQMGAELQGMSAGHGRMDSELAGLVITGAKHPPSTGVAAHGHGFSLQAWVFPCFHCGIETVHVDMRDFPHGRNVARLASMRLALAILLLLFVIPGFSGNGKKWEFGIALGDPMPANFQAGYWVDPFIFRVAPGAWYQSDLTFWAGSSASAEYAILDRKWYGIDAGIGFHYFYAQAKDGMAITVNETVGQRVMYDVQWIQWMAAAPQWTVHLFGFFAQIAAPVWQSGEIERNLIWRIGLVI